MVVSIQHRKDLLNSDGIIGQEQKTLISDLTGLLDATSEISTVDRRRSKAACAAGWMSGDAVEQWQRHRNELARLT